MAEQILPEMQDITRQRDLAKMLLQKGMTDNLQGQMVSGRYVGASPLQGIANMYSAYKGKQLSEEADRKQQELADMLRKQTMQDIQAYGEAVTPVAGVEAKPEFIPQGQTALDDQGMPTYGYQAPVAAVPEKKADFNKGLSILMGSKSPTSQELAKLLMADQLKTLILPEGATAIRGTLGGTTGQTIQGSPKLGQELKDAARQAKLDITKVDQWTDADWAKVRGIEAKIVADKRPVTNVMVNTEQTYGGNLAKGAADTDIALRNSAVSAPDIVSKVARNKKILESGNFFSGKGANIQQEMALYADALGLGGNGTAGKAANTQSLIQGSAETTLNSIKSSGLGSGQGFTDKDREFLQDAKSFRITMNKENIKRVLDLEERAAIESAKKWNQRYKQLPKSATTPIGWTEVEVPKPYGQSDVRSEADAIISGGSR